MMNRLIAFTLGFLSCVASVSQELIIKEVSLQVEEKSSIANFMLDMNGDTCAIVNIYGVEGLIFPNKSQYIDIHKSSLGVYEVYMPGGSRKLSFKHDMYLPGDIDFTQYGFKNLNKCKTYKVVLERHEKKQLGCTVVLKIEPADADVIFDGETQNSEKRTDGSYEIKCREGQHTYSITADNYLPCSGGLSVSKKETKTMALKLSPIQKQLKIICNVNTASVYIDGVNYGRPGELSLQQGKHTIMLRADGYDDYIEQIFVNNNTPKSRSFHLTKKKEKTTIIEPVRLTVSTFGASKNLYINERKIQNWHDGESITILPGNYRFSIDSGKAKKVTIYPGMTSLTLDFGNN